MKDVVTVKDLNYKILKNINFSLEPNTLTALIGMSGSGKTTLLECLSGISNYSGEIKTYNFINKKNSILNWKIGLFLGTINLSYGTVYSNLIEPLNNLRISNQDETISEILKKLGIDKLKDRYINTLSYCEKSIVAFAKSIVHEPSILLIDNILNSLDSYYKNKVIQYLEEFKTRENNIVILVTNDPEDLKLSDNIMILNNGELVETGNNREILQKENIFIKNGLKLPFIIDLSNKLKDYGLVENLVYDNESLVDEIWK